MEDALKLEIIAVGSEMFNGKKCFWTPRDFEIIYNLYNKIHGTDEKDTNCPTCRRAKINSLRDSYFQLVRQAL
jgi:hypothetical protein